MCVCVLLMMSTTFCIHILSRKNCLYFRTLINTSDLSFEAKYTTNGLIAELDVLFLCCRCLPKQNCSTQLSVSILQVVAVVTFSSKIERDEKALLVKNGTDMSLSIFAVFVVGKKSITLVKWKKINRVECFLRKHYQHLWNKFQGTVWWSNFWARSLSAFGFKKFKVLVRFLL